jgi:hypothetical protein
LLFALEVVVVRCSGDCSDDVIVDVLLRFFLSPLLRPVAGTSLASLRIVSGLCVLFHFGTMFSSAELAALPVLPRKREKISVSSRAG